MKITNEQLRQIIKEELERVLEYESFDQSQIGYVDYRKRAHRDKKAPEKEMSAGEKQDQQRRRKQNSRNMRRLEKEKGAKSSESKIQRQWDKLKSSILRDINPVGNWGVEKNTMENFLNQLENVLNFSKNRKQNGAVIDYGIFKGDNAKYALDKIATYKKRWEADDIKALLQDFIGRDDVSKRTFGKKLGSFVRGKGWKEE